MHIEHDRDSWDETTVTPFRTVQDHFDLSGAPMLKLSPVDKSRVVCVPRRASRKTLRLCRSYTSTTRVEGRRVVSRVDFGPSSQKAQVITRALEDGGRTYVVVNLLTVGPKRIEVRSVFRKIDD